MMQDGAGRPWTSLGQAPALQMAWRRLPAFRCDMERRSAVIGLDQKMMQTLNQDGSNGKPCVNSLPGHPERYLVIPIREWDDAEAVPSIGQGRR